MSDADRIRMLTPRQREVLALVLSGLCDKEICARTGIAMNTVSVHLRLVYKAFDVRGRNKLMAKLMVPRFEGLIDAPAASA